MLSHMKFQKVDIAVSQCLYLLSTSGTGHTLLQQHLTEHNQETFASLSRKRGREKEKKTKSIADLFVLHVNAIKTWTFDMKRC